MAQTSVATATRAQAETVIRWLKDEYVDELGGESGFYCNRSIIRRAARDSEMLVLLLGSAIIGFAVFNRYGIDIFEIRSKHRGRGHGRFFAEHIIRDLVTSGSTELNVDCVPHESQHFWRSLGFVDQEEKYQSWSSVKLVLRGPWPNISFKADGFAAA
jgi:GNAT superfamily N-acetyltransferase